MINITNIFNISETRYEEQRAQKNIINFFDNKFLAYYQEQPKVFIGRVHIEIFVLYKGTYKKSRQKGQNIIRL